MVHSGISRCGKLERFSYICKKTNEEKLCNDERTRNKLYILHCKYCSECNNFKLPAGNYIHIRNMVQSYKK